ncbi:MAG: nucleotidyltransferase family protein [Clostridia bacterium]|nr:nucleotidyltransferase family protein [Clostridia bacterium]
MKTAGIICEYNPFHNGHLLQIEKTREAGATHIICVMSGNFVQRGDVSIVPKPAKAQMAIDAGADLVLELPVVWSMATAENFAKGAVSILKNSGVCDMLSFGSECADISLLRKAAAAVNDTAIDEKISAYLNEGISFVQARAKAIEALYGKEIAAVIANPNDILGIEYLNALVGSDIEPLVIERTVPHDGNSESIFYKSAGQIREMLLSGNSEFKKALPHSSYEILRQYASIGQCPNTVEDLDSAILAVLRRMEAEDFKNFSDVSEGLENRIYNAVRQSASVSEILLRSKSKRYTMARMRRIVLSAFLGIGKGYNKSEVPYLRVLGMSAGGKELLKEMKETASKPVIMKYADFQAADGFARKIFSFECRATDLYSLAYTKPAPCGIEMTNTIYISE